MMCLAEIYHERFWTAMEKVGAERMFYTPWVELYMFFPEEVACTVDAMKEVIAEYERSTEPKAEA